MLRPLLAHGGPLIFVMLFVYGIVILSIVSVLVMGVFLVLRKEERPKERRVCRWLGYSLITLSVTVPALLYVYFRKP